MRFNDLFEMRKLVGMKLKDYIRNKGFSKVSFCKMVDISRPTLDKILGGSIDSKTTFDKHLEKILKVLNLDPDGLMRFSLSDADNIDAVYSQNIPPDYRMTEKAKKEYDCLEDILNLCDIYY